MSYQKVYEEWVSNSYFDDAFRNELKAIADDAKEIEDRFYKDLEFGTAGMRGVIGAGKNRINKYIVRKASQGFANYIKSAYGSENLSVAIACDNRIKSDEFALETALVMAGNGIKAYLFESLRTTPELSFSVRELKCQGGVMITASHNPPAYNGYKVYGADGAQLIPVEAGKVVDEVSRVTDFERVKIMSESEAKTKGLLQIIGEKVDRLYYDCVKSLALNKDVYSEPLKVVYTPLHGTGAEAVKAVMHEMGVTDLCFVEEQMVADGNFTTCQKPNPEELQAFDYAIEKGKQENAELLIATDPDCDRVGIVVKNENGEYIALNGNQTGALLVDYMLRSKETLSSQDVVIKTIVTSDFGRIIAESYGVTVMEVLTGFKFIGEKIKQFEETGDHNFLFGYEESYGYLAGTFVRDKDAVVTTMLIIEMAKYYKQQGQNLLEALNALYEKHGCYKENLKSIYLEGKDGLEKMGRIMATLREEPFTKVAGDAILNIIDCNASSVKNVATGEMKTLQLPKSNVLKYTFDDNSWFAVRPSGTEPKIKIYVSAVGADHKIADAKLDAIMNEVSDRLFSIE